MSAPLSAAPSVISSLVITLSPDAALRETALRTLTTDRRIELGEIAHAWLPAVLETDDPPAAIAAIEALPGVLLVEVVFVEVA